MGDYATVADVKLRIGNQEYTADQDTLLAAVVTQASRYVDSQTGTWWDSRAVTVKTMATKDMTRRIFMPAPIVTVTSVTEDGTLLVQGADKDFVAFRNWLEKPGTTYWSRKMHGVVFVGNLGQATVPNDIAAMTAEIAAVFSGLKTKTYVTGEGVAATVNITTLPEWVTRGLAARKNFGVERQQYDIVEA